VVKIEGMNPLKISPSYPFLALTIFSINAFSQHTATPSRQTTATIGSPENCADEIMRIFMSRDGIKAKKGSDNYKNGFPGLGPYPGFKSILFQCEQNKDHLQSFTSCVLDIREGMQASVQRRPTVSVAPDASAHVAQGDQALTQSEIEARVKKAVETADYSGVDRQRSLMSNETAVKWCHLARPDSGDSRSYDEAIQDFKDCGILLYNHTSLFAPLISDSCRKPNARVFSNCVKKSWSAKIGNDLEKQNALVRDCHGQSIGAPIEKVPTQ
jgi:hypothetical protein